MMRRMVCENVQAKNINDFIMRFSDTHNNILEESRAKKCVAVWWWLSNDKWGKTDLLWAVLEDRIEQIAQDIYFWMTTRFFIFDYVFMISCNFFFINNLLLNIRSVFNFGFFFVI
jgi:hypothetical protein